MTYFAPRCAQQHNEQDRAEHAELRCEICKHLGGVNVGILPADIGSGMPNGREAMPGIPDDVGREQRGRDQSRDDGAPAFQRLARFA